MGTHGEPNLAFSARDWVVVGNLQNQAGDRRFDSSLDMAFRLGLQQSRYVNVIPEMRVRQTLMQMKRSPDVNVDLAIGTEVAQREHAKALILPSVTNFGDGVRITVELIDPQTARAVTSTSVDVDDRSDIVSAVDTLVRRLRGTLGESLAQIESSSVPLSQATTSNLEALRVFSLAERARGVGDFKLSLDLARHAIELDPDFASAYALIGADYLTLGQIGPAQKALEQALKRKDRLSQLELVKLQAQKTSSLGTPVEAVAAWKMVSDLYPDQATGPHNVGMYTAAYLNDCESALPYLRHAAELPQPLRAVSLYAVATCELSIGEADAAIRDYQTAFNAGFRGPFLGLADAYVAIHEYGKASDYLNHVPTTAASASNLAIRRALIAADQGDLPAAETFLVQGLQSANASGAAASDWSLRLDLVAVLWADGRSGPALAQTREDMRVLLALDTEARGNLPFDYPTLVAAYSRWAARLGAPTLAEHGIDVVRKAGVLQGYPIRAQLVAVAEAEMALRRGDPEQAVRIADSADSHPLWEVLDVLARAKYAASQPDAPAAFKRVLDARQLALGELYENNLGICTRAIQWNLALLGAAKSLEKSDRSAAVKHAQAFLERWSKAPASLASVREATHLIANGGLASALPPTGNPQD
jgi:putative peptide modification system cyclase